MRQILAAKGLSGDVLNVAVADITRDEEAWVGLMMQNEHGVAAVDPAPMRAALSTFLAFVACGAVPMLPFVTGIASPFAWASAATGAVFFGIGAARAR